MRAGRAACALLAAAGRAAGHGSLIVPPPRNAVDRSLPQWRGGKTPRAASAAPWDPPGEAHPDGMPGTTDPGVVTYFGCDCSNGTEPCDVAQSCFWFSQGCTIGCSTCDGDGTRPPNRDACGSGMKATVNDPKYRTARRNVVAGSPDDIYKYNPWRAPGNAPVYDPCGMAGGNPVEGGLGPKETGSGAEYTNTTFAKQGDLGSRLPPLPTGVVWTAGWLAEASWYLRANHGGGYQYRLCPASEALTEKCFQHTPLDFVAMSLKWKNGTLSPIAGTYVSNGTTPAGSMWAMNPLPQHPTQLFPEPCASTGQVPSPNGFNPGPCSGNWPTGVHVVDTLRVPAGLAPGDYVLQWRWDCEMTAQIWAACADIRIAAYPGPQPRS